MMTIKAGDTEPWQLTLEAQSGSDMTTLSALVIFMRPYKGTTNTIDGKTCVIGVKTATTVEATYAPTPTETSTPGGYYAYVKGTFAGGSVARFPSKGFADVNIHARFTEP